LNREKDLMLIKRKTLALTVIFVLSVLLMVGVHPAKSIPKTITVPDDYASIQEALDNAEDGDTVFVKKGVYVENPVVRKPVTLTGEDRNATVLDVTAGLKVESDGVTVKGFTIYDGYDGISLAGNCCDISGNKITNTTHGIVVFGYENSISDNIFESIGLSSAIQLNFANRNYITSNYIGSCVEGIQIWQNSNNNTIAENIITNCQDTAINFQYSNYNILTRNNISNSGCGTSIYVSNNNTITNNNYVSNTIQFSANEWYALTWGHNRSVNIINKNYWSDYNGTDNNGDSIGDTPYVIDDNNQDNCPLMNPASITSSLQNGYPEKSPSSLPSLEPTSTPEPETAPFPTLPIAAASVTAVGVGAGLLVYFKKRKR
jgi:nitrous oxidase accessory protein